MAFWQKIKTQNIMEHKWFDNDDILSGMIFNVSKVFGHWSGTGWSDMKSRWHWPSWQAQDHVWWTVPQHSVYCYSADTLRSEYQTTPDTIMHQEFQLELETTKATDPASF